jgi:hypothetical protein
MAAFEPDVMFRTPNKFNTKNTENTETLPSRARLRRAVERFVMLLAPE